MELATQRQDLLEQARLALLRLNPPSYGFADAALTEVYVALQVISVIAKKYVKKHRKKTARILEEFFKIILAERPAPLGASWHTFSHDTGEKKTVGA